jgi:hypothetical protein
MLSQLPQFCTSVAGLTQMPLQTIAEPGQRQTPPIHDEPTAQTWPQLPQLLASENVWAQLDPHHVPPAPVHGLAQPRHDRSFT